MAHCKINNGYKIKNGGVGTVSIIVNAHPILSAHANISRKQRRGLLCQSSWIHIAVF
jgi:hypothetical protein